ncbi:hypothetical protein CC2G_009105 [Coprinopsis cinerea AmutBmut pab1-1]|nr:hypothetical protein CC2G_009105 [Coprinopsis cinerea AmutBmut pab1-1]
MPKTKDGRNLLFIIELALATNHDDVALQTTAKPACVLQLMILPLPILVPLISTIIFAPLVCALVDTDRPP